jgi:hypothetical protein
MVHYFVLTGNLKMIPANGEHGIQLLQTAVATKDLFAIVAQNSCVVVVSNHLADTGKRFVRHFPVNVVAGGVRNILTRCSLRDNGVNAVDAVVICAVVIHPEYVWVSRTLRNLE